MFNFTNKQKKEFIDFVTVTIANEIKQQIQIDETEYVKGGLFGDEIVEAIKIRFYPQESKTNDVENTIKSKIHRYVFENDLGLNCELAIEKDINLGKIRYNLIYTYAGDYVNCENCQRKCKRGVTRCLYPIMEA